jgi:hypothetical protein
VNKDFTKLGRKALFKLFEDERQMWLAEGMSESDIYRIHFGTGDGYSDYGVWLSERKHTRTDHKYARGTPVAIDAADLDSAWISGGDGGIGDAIANIDFEAALSKLTPLQRHCYVETVMKERTQQSVADELGKCREDVKYAVGAAKRNLKKYYP